MARAQMSRIASAAVFVVSALLCGKTALASSIELDNLDYPTAVITGSIELRIDGSTAGLLNGLESAVWPVSSLVETSKIAPQPTARNRDDPSDEEFEYLLRSKVSGHAGVFFGKGDSVRLDAPQVKDVPLPPALLLLNSAILGLVFVGRRDKGPHRTNYRA